jgi:hypothetical protein
MLMKEKDSDQVHGSVYIPASLMAPVHSNRFKISRHIVVISATSFSQAMS